MIDYEKLEQTYILCEKLESWCFNLQHSEYGFEFQFTHDGYTCSYMTLGELIDVLQRLTQPKAKYKVGDRVWFIDCTKRYGPICDGIIDSIETVTRQFNEQCNFVKIGCFQIPEECCYPSRESLIDAQINYWYDLKMETVKDSLSKCVPPFEGEVRGFSSLADNAITRKS
jgi:hypothetical protein